METGEQRQRRMLAQDDLSNREHLLARIAELEALNRELLREKEQETRLEYAWTGNLGQWYWNVKTNTVTFNPLKVTTLGYDMDDVPEPVPFQFFTDKLHPDDYHRTMQAMMDHLHGTSTVYEVEYRIRTRDGAYKWYYDRGRITQRDENGKPLFLAGIVFNITEKKERLLALECDNRTLTELSTLDGLTQINNHRAVVEALKALITAPACEKDPLSIAMLDIDDFKRVNDTKGHVYGDKVLADVAAILKQRVRDTDTVGRYGGEEFMIVFPGADVEKAFAIADRIRQAIAAHAQADGLRVTVSGGVHQYQGDSLAEFIAQADAKLYRAKRNGKDQICAV